MKSSLMYVISNEAAAEQALGQLLKLLQAQFTEQTTVSATSLDVFVDPSYSPCCDKDRILIIRVIQSEYIDKAAQYQIFQDQPFYFTQTKCITP